MIYGLTKERVEEIKKKYKEDKALFNWCDEYKQFINEGVSVCVSYEWDYMIKKSFEENDSPCSYEDLDLFDMDKAEENILYELEQTDNEIKKEVFELIDEEIKTIEDLKKYIKELDKDELRNLYNDIEQSRLIDLADIHECESEVYEWWIVQDPLSYRLEQQGEIFLNGAWGRCTTGQSISLDYCCIKAFMDLLEDLF